MVLVPCCARLTSQILSTELKWQDSYPPLLDDLLSPAKLAATFLY